MSALLGLADRCEAATVPNRELDALIHFRTHDRWKDRCATAEIFSIRGVAYDDGIMSIEGGGFIFGDHVPAYTASLDAAMTLVPDHDTWSATSCGPEGVARAYVTLCDDDYATDYVADAVTPALALCAAALRARASAIEAQRGETAQQARSGTDESAVPQADALTPTPSQDQPS